MKPEITLTQDRFELKYLVRWETYESILRDISPYVQDDVHAGERGRYEIISLYYDSPDLMSYWEKINGLNHRNKLRIRQYAPTSLDAKAFIEIKQKIFSTVKKVRVPMTLRQAYEFLDGTGGQDELVSMPAMVRKSGSAGQILYLKYLYQMEPKVIISYTRQPFVGIYDNRMRITFDMSIRARATGLRLEEGGWGEYVVSPEFVLVEVKVDQKIPEWMTSVISHYNLEPIRFSKYCLGLQKAMRYQQHYIV